VVLGNPPWERVKLQEQEFFAARDPVIAAAAGAGRKRMIAELRETDPALDREYRIALRRSESEGHFLRASGRYRSLGAGSVNTYVVFAETMRSLIAPMGRAGIIVPTGIATDDTTKQFFASLVERRSLASLYDFENAAPIFPGVHRSYKFCLLTMAGPERPMGDAEFVFFAHRVEDLAEDERRFHLTIGDFRVLNPNTRTCPIFRTRRDAEITRRIYQRIPVLVDRTRTSGNPWDAILTRMFHMTDDSALFRTWEQLESAGWTLDGDVFRRDDEAYLPLYEAKLFHHFDHRYASYGANGETSGLTAIEKADPRRLAIPRYWVEVERVAQAMAPNDRGWLLAWRNIARTTDERSLIAAALPSTAVGHSAQLMVSRDSLALVLPLLDSFAFDFVVRQKLGGTNMTFFTVEQLPVLPPSAFRSASLWEPSTTVERWIAPRIAELCCTAVDMQPLADELGFPHAPFRWNDARRALLRNELDAAFFHLYGLDRDEVDYVMDTFPIVRRKDERAYGEYRTKRLILERYDALASAIATGVPYETVLDPPPAHPSVAHRGAR
jgi:hypothetical protein